MREWMNLVGTMSAMPQSQRVDEADHAVEHNRGGLYLCPHCESRMPMNHLAERCPVCHQDTEASGVTEAVAPSTPRPASLTAPAPLAGGARVLENRMDSGDQRRSFRNLQELAAFKSKQDKPTTKRAKNKAFLSSLL